MRFDVITLFPELFGPHLQHGVTRRAFASAQVDVKLWPLRDFAQDSYRRVDDRPFGGGPGMVMLAPPLMRALDAVRAQRNEPLPCPVIHFTPSGVPMTQALVREFASAAGAVLVCGRYEGVDQRFVDHCITHEVSLGDFVLSGGELPALALLDAVARLQEGVLTVESHEQDSFAEGLLEGPCYSRPDTLAFGDQHAVVPPVLLSGNHGQIARWRRDQALVLTARRRPELIAQARAAGKLSKLDEACLRALGL